MGQLLQKIGFIGAGNMGEAMIGALIQAGVFAPDRIFVHDIRPEVPERLQKTYKIEALPDNLAILRKCDAVVLAVKPQSMDRLLSDLTGQNAFNGLAGRKLILSIAAGIRIKKFEERIYPSLGVENRRQLPILRVMPNTPALVRSGISGVCANAHATREDMQAATTILSAMGEVIECREKDMDALTAMSGSGPAYCFYLAEAMIEAGIRLGFDADTAARLTRATLKGAVALMEHQHEPPEALRRRVTSPGGTTQAAIAVFETHALKQVIGEAILAAAQRSRELSE